MLTPLYARGILRWSKSIYGLIVFVLLWTVYSGDHIHCPECQFGYPRISCCGGDALVLARDRGVVGFAWILAFAACIFSIMNTSAAMSAYGFSLSFASSWGASITQG